MNEKPLERLNYHNGQRLEANDLKVEQEYHIRVRRWLNKSLYSSGIARGLEVHAEAGGSTVVVGPGLALDTEGREIILLEEQSVPVMGHHSKIDGEVEGNYLIIQYREQTKAEEDRGCKPLPNGHDKSSSRIAWGGPARLLAKPILSWSDILPHESSGKIVLGQVELDEKCLVRRVHLGVRRSVRASSASTVRQYALEGERHINKANPGRIYFHVRGGKPNTVTLYLRAERFSTLYYTEMGGHSHSLSLKAGIESSPPILDPLKPDKYKHSHTLNDIVISDEVEPHTHSSLELTFYARGTSAGPSSGGALLVGGVEPDPPPGPGRGVPFYDNILVALSDPAGKVTGFNGVDKVRNPPEPFSARIAGASRHNHLLTGKTSPDKVETDLADGIFDHTHRLSPEATLGSAGVSDPAYSARGGDALHPPDPTNNPIKPLTYVKELQVYVDGTSPANNMTNKILDQLNAAQANNWTELGNGEDNHLLVTQGSGPIKLDFLSTTLNFTEGEHFVELRVDADGVGGRVLYNLYVE